MDKNKVFDFYEKMYFKELDEMNLILSRFPILITGTALIVSAYVFLIKFDGFVQLNNYLQSILLILMFAVISYLLVCLSKTFKTHEYTLIESLDLVEEKRKEFKEYELNIKQGNLKGEYRYQVKEESAEDMFRDALIDKFILCTKANALINNERRGYFHESMFAIWLNITFCFIIMALSILF
ncbi:hypothetical protein [Wohlfahrtiimonas chitiniclastica]|uniref:hypothetical protein n=1 Tax=Wohlfahrtiimonas chitiniclastica TaxID=400946 RepID=UPI001BCAE0EB|nr:hypothetical protein [Wohlfahrtiimonas chitiniclastica]MBS7837371.1 hypothetical protein [Wohlfahrtiimonas chitiniclastica]